MIPSIQRAQINLSRKLALKRDWTETSIFHRQHRNTGQMENTANAQACSARQQLELHPDLFFVGGLVPHISLITSLITPWQSAICQHCRRSHLPSIWEWWAWEFLQPNDLQSPSVALNRTAVLFLSPMQGSPSLGPHMIWMWLWTQILGLAFGCCATCNAPSVSTCKCSPWQKTKMPLSHSTINRFRVKILELIFLSHTYTTIKWL